MRIASRAACRPGVYPNVYHSIFSRPVQLDLRAIFRAGAEFFAPAPSARGPPWRGRYGGAGA
jgi:hypothetical protein